MLLAGRPLDAMAVGHGRADIKICIPSLWLCNKNRAVFYPPSLSFQLAIITVMPSREEAISPSARPRPPSSSPVL